MNNFVLLAGAGDFFHATPILAKYQFISKCFHLRAGAQHHFSSQRKGAKGLLDSPFPLEDETWLEGNGGGGGRNNLPPCEICQQWIPGSHLTKDLSFSLGGLPPGKQKLLSSFHALCISNPPWLLLLSHCKMGMLWGSFKMKQLFSWGLPYGTHSMILFLAYLAFLFSFFFSLCFIHKSTLTLSKESYLESSFKVQCQQQKSSTGKSCPSPAPPSSFTTSKSGPPSNSQLFTELHLWSLGARALLTQPEAAEMGSRTTACPWGTFQLHTVGIEQWFIWLGFLQFCPYHNANCSANNANNTILLLLLLSLSKQDSLCTKP